MLCLEVTKTDECTDAYNMQCVMVLFYGITFYITQNWQNDDSAGFSLPLHFYAICHTVINVFLFAPSFIQQTDGLFNAHSTNSEWLRDTKTGIEMMGGECERTEVRRSVKEGTKTTPSDCR